MSGKAKGEGPFVVIAGTYRYVLDPQFVDINVKIDCRRSSFSIPASWMSSLRASRTANRLYLEAGRCGKVKNDTHYNPEPEL